MEFAPAELELYIGRRTTLEFDRLFRPNGAGNLEHIRYLVTDKPDMILTGCISYLGFVRICSAPPIWIEVPNLKRGTAM